MNIYYQKIWGISLMILSRLGIVIELLSLLLGANPSVNLITGIITLVCGYLFFTRPLFFFSRDSIVIYNLFGKPIKHYSFESLADLDV